MNSPSIPSRRGTVPCRHWLNGTCYYGKNCSFKHGSHPNRRFPIARRSVGTTITTPSTTSTSRSSPPPCKFWLRGNCLKADKCWYRHDPEERGEVSKGNNGRTGPAFQCSICLESKLPERFPVLSNCLHRVHPECLKEWRRRDKWGNLHDKPSSTCPFPHRATCPECEAPIHFVVMSTSSWALDEEDHQRIIEGYLHRQAKMPCKYFTESVEIWKKNGRNDEGYLFCPRGDQCHFQHRLPGFDVRYQFSSRQVNERVGERGARASRELEGSESRSAGNVISSPVATTEDYDSDNTDDSDSKDSVRLDDEDREFLASLPGDLPTSEWIGLAIQYHLGRIARASHG